MRSFKFITASLAAVLILSGCGGQGSSDESPSPSTSDSSSASATPSEEVKTLDNIDSITVSDNYGEDPTVEAEYSFKVNQTMSRVIVEGDGPAVPDSNATVEVNYVGYNASTGEKFDSSFDYGSPVTFSLAQVVTGFSKGLDGAKQGSRVLIAITSGDGYDPQGNTSAGINPGDTLLFVVDVERVQINPSGEMAQTPSGSPKVSDNDGVPAIDIAGAAEPTEITTTVLIPGSGRTVADGDNLVTNAVCSAWDGNEYYNDYDQGYSQDSASTALAPLYQQLVGQKDGSRVLVTIPGEQAYPNGNSNPPLEPNTSVACVVDIEFSSSASS